MPRRRQPLAKHTVQIVIGGTPITVILHPPQGPRRSWYAYWSGLTTSRSTGQAKLDEAIVAVENMVRTWLTGGEAKRAQASDLLLTDEEFDEIQHVHYFGKKSNHEARMRAAKTFNVFVEAATAFRAITGLTPITRATSADCERFQREALGKPKNWRQQHPKSKKDVTTVSANTVLKWSRSLQASFERASRNAGKKCVRSVVPDSKLLDSNPWNLFTWIEGFEKPVRQFDSSELLSFLDHLATIWPGVPVAQTLAKVFLWSRCRLEATTSLQWKAERSIGTERHFHVVEKRGVEWWFRLPEGVYEELLAQKTKSSPYVFAAYAAQLRQFHAMSNRPDRAAMVGSDFSPRRLGDWFYDRLDDWSDSSPHGHAHPHTFRKTSLQLSWDGESERRQAIQDAKVSEKVLRTSYLRKAEKELREESIRNYDRIAAGLRLEVAARYGYTEPSVSQLEARLAKAVADKDMFAIAQLAAELNNRLPPTSG
jgi:integrase